MKKTKFLSMPIRVSELHLDELYDYDDTSSIKATRINAQKLRKFKRGEPD